MKKKEKDMSILQIIFYSIVILITIVILIISMVGINLLDIIVILGISFLFIYLDSRSEDGNTVDWIS